ncbi:MAG: hypothetical protein ABI811_06415, partial [Acidobacteriota bacterium]
DLWADYLEQVAEFRSGLPWLEWAAPSMLYGTGMGRRSAYQEYAQKIHQWFPELESSLPDEIARRVEQAEAGGAPDPRERGAVWTYITTDQPFGTWTERILRGLRRRKSQPA